MARTGLGRPRCAARALLSLFAATALVAVASARPAEAFVHQKAEVLVPVRDGRSLAANVYRPSTSGTWPTILVQTPYDKDVWDLIFLYETSTDPLFKSAAYTWVVLDWRGFFDSAGAAYAGSPTRGQDGHDVVQWIAAQPWSNGKVGGWGESAQATALVATAQENPPALDAGVASVYFWREGYDLSYPGGVYYRNRNDAPFGNGPTTKTHPLYDSFWSYVESSTAPVSQVSIPMLHVSGWYDHLTEVTLREFQRVQTGGATGAAGQQKMLIGPWTHTGVRQAAQGQLSYPDAATAQAHAAVELFDHYLRGVANGYPSQPIFRYYRINDAAWSGSTTWPPAEATTRSYYLRADATLGTTAPSSSETPRAYVANPATPVPTLFGAVVNETAATRGPGNLASLESRSDVLAFTTAPLAEPLAIVGRPRARLRVTSTTVDTDLAVRLTQVRSDGSSMLIVDGIRRASLRNGYTSKQLLASGTTYTVDVDLPSVAITVPAGDRLRVLVAPSNHDRFDKNVQDGSSVSDDAGAVATTGTIQLLLDAARPSTLELPLIDPPTAGVPPDPPSSLSAAATSSSAIQLAWTDGSDDEAGFVLERSLDGSTYAAIASIAPNTTNHLDSGLTASTTYRYRVRAWNEHGDSPYSNDASATTQAPPATIPVAPSNLAATAVQRTSVALAWTDNSSDETSFRLERSTNNSTFTLVATLGPNVRTYTNTGLKRNTSYFYRVRAQNAAGSSTWSNTLTVKTLR